MASILQGTTPSLTIHIAEAAVMLQKALEEINE